LRHDVLAPLGVPRHPLAMAQFGLLAMRSARSLAESRFAGERARALFAGMAAHSTLPLNARFSAAIALVLGVCGHTAGWPFPRGGAQRIADALAGHLRSLGGEILCGSPVTTLPDAPIVMCDITPRQMLALTGKRLGRAFARALRRYRYGPGAFKLDWSLDGPIPWRARECERAATVHLGGTLAEIAAWEARHEGLPFVILAQHTLFDTSRAPAGMHTAWGYCHVPNDWEGDMTEAIEAQVERFAPGFRARILARHAFTPAAMERHNPNLIGGDFSGGAMDGSQLFLRPTWRTYGTPLAGVYFCGSSTPPGGGVHGMCGYHAARSALGSSFRDPGR
jgi:phytoene dehydrogenase-like protein